MIDTIVLKFREIIPQDKLELWDYSKNFSRSGNYNTHYSYIYNLNNGAVVKYLYYKYDFTGQPLTTVEFSIPTVLFGNNIRSVNNQDIQRLMYDAMEWADFNPLVPRLYLGYGTIKRIDFFYDHKVNSRLHDYLKTISQLNYPHRHRIVYDNHKIKSASKVVDNGVVFQSKQVRSKYYDKFLESGNPLSEGRLRQEVEVRAKKRLHDLFDREPVFDTILDNILPIAKQVLEDDLVALGLDRVIPFNKDTAFQTLKEKYRSHQVLSLLGFLQVLEIYPLVSNERLADIVGKSVQSVIKAKRELRRAGISPGITTFNQPLHQLSIAI